MCDVVNNKIVSDSHPILVTDRPMSHIKHVKQKFQERHYYFFHLKFESFQ